MIEFSDYLEKLYQGKDAVRQRVYTRLRHTTSDIPYYSRGVDNNIFTYGNEAIALRLGLRDFGPNVELTGENSRIKVCDVEIDVSNLLNSEG